MPRSEEERKAKHREQQRIYRFNNPEKVRAYGLAWRLKNQAKIREQRVLQIANGNKKRSRVREKLKHTERFRARKAVYSAVKHRTLIRPSECSKCHRSCKPQAHHEDYSKQLEVRWLCQGCHLSEHGKTRRAG